MGNMLKKVSNPFSTGGGGVVFETYIQASYVLLMLTGGNAPCLPCWPVKKVKLQARKDGVHTDDLLVVVEDTLTKRTARLFAQIKHDISFTRTSNELKEVLVAAWHDYNNPSLFTKEIDQIALITSALSKADRNALFRILGQVKSLTSHTEFFQYTQQRYFFSSTARTKLEVIRECINIAAGQDVSDKEVYDFLRHFNVLGYDLQEETGVILSLIHSHISQFDCKSPEQLWSRVVVYVQNMNKNGGNICLENIPQDILSAFKRDDLIPRNFLTTNTAPLCLGYSDVLSVACLLGSWDESCDGDLAIIKRLVRDYDKWNAHLRKLSQEPHTPLVINNGIWQFTDRLSSWSAFGGTIFDTDLETFKTIAIEVLSEVDPAFELEPDARFASSIYGKKMKHSARLRSGIVESLALLGNHDTALKQCSRGKSSSVPLLVVRSLFGEMNWMLWASLDRHIPLLAEAAPEEFLSRVEALLIQPNNIFRRLFDEEGDAITGSYYMCGVLWALEGLAWTEKLLARVTGILGELASFDPGGQYGNRPIDSLKDIFLPWKKHSRASVEKKQVALNSLKNDFPTVAWNLLIKLLPNQSQMTTGTHKPKWFNTLPSNYDDTVTYKEYYDTIDVYAMMAVQLVCDDLSKMTELIGKLHNLPEESFEKIITYLGSCKLLILSDEERFPIWSHLEDFTLKHRVYQDTNWSLDEASLKKVEDVASKIKPCSPLIRHQRIFNKQNHELYYDRRNRTEELEKIRVMRNEALREVIDIVGLSGVVDFVNNIKESRTVGTVLAQLEVDGSDLLLIPCYLGQENFKIKSFVNSYVAERFFLKGWSWVDSLETLSWSTKQKAELLSGLPFNTETWQRVGSWLEGEGSEYWTTTYVECYQKGCDLEFAAAKLLEVGRCLEAVECLYMEVNHKKTVDINLALKILETFIESPNQFRNNMDSYHINEVIRFLQDTPDIDEDRLMKVEFSFLPILDDAHQAEPKILNNWLSTKAEFFCETIQILYKSKNEEGKSVNENLVFLGWKLLHQWKKPPGVNEEGFFVVEEFLRWFNEVKDICQASGHLEVALDEVGTVLFYLPEETDGLWLPKEAAKLLNQRNMEKMRRGYCREIYNSRGAHRVVPDGSPERKLAEKWRQRADQIENEGFHRFAADLRSVASCYDQDAERIVDRTKQEKLDDLRD